jgi:hypothetical protein
LLDPDFQPALPYATVINVLRSQLGIVVWCALPVAACAPAVETGPPIPEPETVASRVRQASGIEDPSRVDFSWEYGDEKGTLRGEGVGRINPPDVFRIDFFSTGEGSMAAVLVGDSLSTLGQIEDVQLPSPPLMYAMAGVFRPGSAAVSRGFEQGEEQVLVYETAGRPTRLFVLCEGRIVRVEERQAGRLIRRVELEWEEGIDWPREAEYRDNVTPSRARWRLDDVRTAAEPFPEKIYDLGTPAP